MKRVNNYPEMINYFAINNDEGDFDHIIEDIKNDIYNKDLVLMIIDHLNDDYMIEDSDPGLIREMFEYYRKHGKEV